MGGSGGGVTNRFDSNDQEIAAHNENLANTELLHDTAKRNTMDYASHKTETGAKSTLFEYLAAQKEAGKASVGRSKPQNIDLPSVGNQKKENASMSKEVAVPNSPIFNLVLPPLILHQCEMLHQNRKHFLQVDYLHQVNGILFQVI